MSRRYLLAALVTASAGTAYAQAPGQVYDAPYESPPTYAPYYAQPPVVRAEPPLPGRLSIGVAMMGSTFQANNIPSATADFEGASFAISYRPWRKVSLELSLGGGRETLAGGMDGELAMGAGTLAARYHFNQQDHWNFWLLFGVGATTIERHDATESEIDRAQRPHVAFGAGLEYRFTSFALQLEVRALGLGQTEEEKMLQDQGVYTSEGLSGGVVTLGAAYYFGTGN